MSTDTINPVTQPANVLNSSRFISALATDPLGAFTDENTVSANNNDIVELSPVAQNLLDYYQNQYNEDVVLKKAQLEKIIAENKANDIITAQALQSQLAGFDPSSQLLDTLNSAQPASQPVDLFANTLPGAQPQADNDNITYQLLLQLQNITLVA